MTRIGNSRQFKRRKVRVTRDRRYLASSGLDGLPDDCRHHGLFVRFIGGGGLPAFGANLSIRSGNL